MRFALAEKAFAAVWVVALGAAGVAAGVTATFSWIALATLALISLVMMKRLWREPAQTMSESVQQVRR